MTGLPLCGDQIADHNAARYDALQSQQAVLARVEILDQGFRTEGRMHGRHAGLFPFHDQADAETMAVTTTVADHVQVAALEYAQAQRSAGQQDRM